MSSQPFGSVTVHSLTDETALSYGEYDLILTIEQFEGLDPHVRRRFAAASDFEGINGRSTKLEQMSYFVCQRSLKEYE